MMIRFKLGEIEIDLPNHDTERLTSAKASMETIHRSIRSLELGFGGDSSHLADLAEIFVQLESLMRRARASRPKDDLEGGGE